MTNFRTSLYELIKQKFQEKGRPLKIVCDWDECLQPVNPFFFYKLAKEKKWELPKKSLKEWVDYYWENARIEYKKNKKGRKIPITVYVGIEKIEEIRNKDPNWLSEQGIFNEMVRKPAFKIMDSPNFYEESPFFSIAEELLVSLREGLISKLVVVTASNGGPKSRKKTIFNKTFAKLPNTELIAEEIGRFSKRGVYRWKWIQENHPDFDIFIDDNPEVIQQAKENLPTDKIFVVPDYKNKILLFRNQDKGGIYYVKNTVSDLKDSDFALTALEKQVEALAKKIKEETKLGSEFLGWLILLGGIIIFLITGVLILLMVRKKR